MIEKTFFIRTTSFIFEVFYGAQYNMYYQLKKDLYLIEKDLYLMIRWLRLILYYRVF
jgi:hypothetical protein